MELGAKEEGERGERERESRMGIRLKENRRSNGESEKEESKERGKGGEERSKVHG